MSARESTFSQFFHQTLPSWEPKLTVKNTTPVFIVIGIVFIIIGIVILYILRNSQEIRIDYTKCVSTTNASATCAEVIGKTKPIHKTCFCELNFTLEKDIEAPVNIYYALTKFYQNHRSYVSSKDNKQLMGELQQIVSKDCFPYDYVNGIPIVPCGAIANSMFSDHLHIYSVNYSMYVPVIKTNISWPILKKNKYKNPPGDLKEVFKNYAKPVAWDKHIWELDPDDESNNGLENEDLIVWMEPATMSSFKKMYRRVNHTMMFNQSLPAGRYELHVNYSFPTAAFKGTKSLVIANTSVFGTKNVFLGIVYIIVGCICLLISLIFCVLQYKYKKYLKKN